MGYGVTIWYNRLRPILTETEGEGRWDTALNKQSRLSESRSKEAKRKSEELRSKLTSREKAEGGFIQNLVSRRPFKREGYIIHGGEGEYLSGGIIMVRWHWVMNGGT